MTDPLQYLEDQFGPALHEVARKAAITDHLIDKDIYRILVTTLWVNVVLRPADVGLIEEDLEPLHDLINRYTVQVLGADQTLTECFRWLNGKPGEQAMRAAHLTEHHRDLLLYFASMILDPDGHKRWMDEIAAEQAKGRR